MTDNAMTENKGTTGNAGNTGWSTATQYLVSCIALTALVATIGFAGVWVITAAHGDSSAPIWAGLGVVSLIACVVAFVSAVRAIGHLGLQRPLTEDEKAGYEAQYAPARAS